MPKVLPEYLELRRQQILDASAACFVRRGFHATTMQDICKEADLSPGAVYRYFPSKESIIHAMCDHNTNVKIEAIEEAMEQGNTFEVFADLIRTFFVEIGESKATENCAMNVELIAEAPRSEPIREWLTQSLAATHNLFSSLIKAAQKRGEIDPTLDPLAVSQVMVALYHGFVTQRLVDPNIDAEGYASVVRSLFGGSFWKGATTSPGAPASALIH
jgi:AcrR family transcriptional regulator